MSSTALLWLSSDERQAMRRFATANGWGLNAALRHAVRLAYMGGDAAALTVQPPPAEGPALCELCHAREASWYIVPVGAGRGVDVCAVCHARQPAAVLDLWRVRQAVQP